MVTLLKLPAVLFSFSIHPTLQHREHSDQHTFDMLQMQVHSILADIIPQQLHHVGHPLRNDGGLVPALPAWLYQTLKQHKNKTSGWSFLQKEDAVRQGKRKKNRVYHSCCPLEISAVCCFVYPVSEIWGALALAKRVRAFRQINAGWYPRRQDGESFFFTGLRGWAHCQKATPEHICYHCIDVWP